MSSLLSSAGLFCLVVAFWLLGILLFRTVYRIFFHPLARYPGPRLAAITPLVHVYHFVAGDAVAWLDGVHRRYGDVVRVEPNRLSYIAPQAWKDVYGHATGTRRANSKEQKNSRNLFANGSYSISSAHGAEHQRLRKIFSNAFSDQSITRQEPMLTLHARRMVDLVRREIEAQQRGLAAGGASGGGAADGSVVMDAVQLFNFATFDIMADLAFGESLGCLDNNEGGSTSAWVDAVQVNFKRMIIRSRLGPYPVLSRLWHHLHAGRYSRAATIHVQSSHDRVTRRIEKGDDGRADIWGLVLKAEGPNALTRTEMNNNANNFMIVGTETSATALSALTYILLKNPGKLERLIAEIRSAVSDSTQLTGDVLRKMRYLQACLNECLRLHPPVPTGGMRVIGADGNTILGHMLPEDTKMSIASWTAFRAPQYWKDGDSFVPERWMPGESGYEEYHEYDRREVFQAFGAGPHACIGKNLASQEMRLLYAQFVFHYDMELCPESDRWMEDQKCWTLWFKENLRIKVSMRKAV